MPIVFLILHKIEKVMYNTRTILPTDDIFITLVQNGKNILNIYHNNFSDIAEIVKMVYSYAKECTGIALLSVRNKSQGWCFNVPLMFTSSKLATSATGKFVKRQKIRQCELPFDWQ